MKSILFTFITLCGSIYIANQAPARVVKLIDLADQLKTEFANNYWSEWSQMDMPLLLVGDEREFVFNSEVKDSTFEVNNTNNASRASTFNKHFLATFPLLNSKPTIVVGTPENTNKTPEAWTVTLLHEHFHQLQMNHPNYYSAQKALNLDKGDQTGMWMLNHPFPYEDEKVNLQMKKMAINLTSSGSMDPSIVLQNHKKEKAALHEIIGDEHYKYLNMQLWQEGYARFIEIEITNDWLDHFDEIKQDQFTKIEIENLVNEQQEQIIIHLKQSSPKELKRVYFYALGAAEASLISKTNRNWKQEYFENLFTTDHLLKLNP
ncbi:MAG: hypothetical protein CMB80_20410 [Flammeovirgaceae bacterium]|nr:hypothetical protein [Flammeovirgaceae bacterium]MBE63135.1 hypothetical protein [Flammeovirgaceae bacterium]HCX20949.1 hypothetical protein [Cytophagales bacterium]|tara:strand:- start:5772 stop:6728 length:957 start_codon:yes stop_codon:yes gene_type:complete